MPKPGQSALGKRWGYGRDDGSTAWITVVGVATDQFRSCVDEEELPVAYVPHLQASRIGGRTPLGLDVALRTGVDPTSVTAGVRAAIAEYDPDLPMTNVRAMSDAVAVSMSSPRLMMTLLGIFAVLALILAVGGVYGTVSIRSPAERARSGYAWHWGQHVTTSFGWLPAKAQSLWLWAFAWVGGAWLATRLVTAMLYGVVPTDLGTSVAVPLVLICDGIVASFIPALRATRIAPTEALRRA